MTAALIVASAVLTVWLLWVVARLHAAGGLIERILEEELR